MEIKMMMINQWGGEKKRNDMTKIKEERVKRINKGRKD